MMRRRDQEAAERQAERRRREDEAPRLATAIPQLESLCLELQERRAGFARAEGTHTRRIVVKHAPALFIVPCHDPRCKDGGHDVTSAVMRALHSRLARFEGETACNGIVGSAECHTVLHYVGVAEYRHDPRELGQL